MDSRLKLSTLKRMEKKRLLPAGEKHFILLKQLYARAEGKVERGAFLWEFMKKKKKMAPFISAREIGLGLPVSCRACFYWMVLTGLRSLESLGPQRCLTGTQTAGSWKKNREHIREINLLALSLTRSRTQSHTNNVVSLISTSSCSPGSQAPLGPILLLSAV